MADDNRLTGSLDAVLHLLDRQVVDVEGLLVCKVDDVELTELDDGVLGVTALLAGPAALTPRYGDEAFATASTRAASRSCSATCRSGWRTSSTGSSSC